jgi:carbon monoxide dehydrogenase subunit G
VHLEHSFSVPVGIDEAWKILLDIERVGPCMPGASIDSVDGDDFTGTVKVKLGPINLTYKGKASFVEKDETTRRAVIDARGRDARGNGTAAAVVTATLADAGGSTTVHVNTELDITGKPAQFGRGVMVDVGNKLIGQFADALAGTLQAGESPSAAEPAPTADVVAEEAAPAAVAAAKNPTRPRPVRTQAVAEEPATPVTESAPTYSMNGHVSRPASQPQREVEPINLLEHAGPAVAKRLAPVAVGLVIIGLAIRRRRAKRG